MPNKDLSQKLLVQLPDVFADIFNGIVFHGEQVIRPENLKPRPTEAIVQSENSSLKGMLRDVCKEDTRSGVDYIILGTENQSGVDYTMPQRVMGLDYASYEEEIRRLMRANVKAGYKAGSRRIRKGQKISPAVTLVLNYGKKWDGPLCLKDMLKLPDGKYETLLPFIQDYRINLVNLADLTEEDARKFRSDFRFLVKYMIREADEDSLRELFEDDNDIIEHPRETLLAMAAITKDDRFLEISEDVEERSDVSMCFILDEAEKRGIEIGIRAFIDDNLEEGKRDEVICEKLCRRFELTQAEAQGYLKKAKDSPYV